MRWIFDRQTTDWDAIRFYYFRERFSSDTIFLIVEVIPPTEPNEQLQIRFLVGYTVYRIDPETLQAMVDKFIKPHSLADLDAVRDAFARLARM